MSRDDPPRVLPCPIRFTGLLLSVAALVLAGLLTWWSLKAGAHAPGCGEGTGCGAVLGSKWSRVLGIPVGAAAAVLYAALCGLFVAGSRKSAWVGNLVCGLIFGGVAWFVVLQLFVIRSVCPYCMVDHALGGAAAVVFVVAARGRARWVGVGTAASVALVVFQTLAPERPPLILFGTAGATSASRNGERVLVLAGEELVPAAEPRFGNPDAERLMAIAVDYACPHCRGLHRLASEQVARESGNLCVVLLPTPIHPDCNPAMISVPDRFANSCEVAALSLAVFEKHPDAWPDFDAWLFEPERPRPVEEVRARARGLLGDGAAEARNAAQQRVDRNVRLFATMPVGDGDRRVPVTWGVGRPPVVGPIRDPGFFHELSLPPEPSEESHHDRPRPSRL